MEVLGAFVASSSGADRGLWSLCWFWFPLWISVDSCAVVIAGRITGVELVE